MDQAEGRCRLTISPASAIWSPRWLRPAGLFAFLKGEQFVQQSHVSLCESVEFLCGLIGRYLAGSMSTPNFGSGGPQFCKACRLL
ncbi:hypothetical protein ACSBOB_01475 [Mesorhizobium sp. ASY16-5R]|uniref:hypothetical protein n=1 Tax=Mesorhizobium sp. ASY16-5R TaxID=3445772 RepID=UPI003F9FE57A